jgi:hypothetical protein
MKTGIIKAVNILNYEINSGYNVTFSQLHGLLLS